MDRREMRKERKEEDILQIDLAMTCGIHLNKRMRFPQSDGAYISYLV
jgi:hypothetical protein